MKQQILSTLSCSFPWAEHIHYFDCIDSTNSRAKEMASAGAPHGTAVLAGQQTGGRGRMGRSFHSPAKLGLYLSVILRPIASPTDLMHLTCATGVAVCNAVARTLGFRPGLKWANDLVWQKRKLGGILTELSISPKTGMVDYAIIGIGINCNQAPQDFPEDIRDIAGSVLAASGEEVEIPILAANLLSALESLSRELLSNKKSIMEQYRNDCITLGQEISVITPNSIRHGIAKDIDEDGALLVSFSDGSLENINTGEVSIRGMYGYL